MLIAYLCGSPWGGRDRGGDFFIMKLPYAEDINYWKTSQSQPESWIDKSCKLISDYGGMVYTHAFGQDDNGNSAYMIQFQVGEDRFKLVWPVLPSYKEDEKSAKRQAATLMYHDVKAKCLTAKILGSRTAFFNYLMLPDGRTASEASFPELMQNVPLALAGYDLPQIESGD